MPIVITPTGQFVDSATGNPVDLPPQRPELPMRSRTGATSEMEMRAMDQAMQDPNLRNLNIPPMSEQEVVSMLTEGRNMGMEDVNRSAIGRANLSETEKVGLLVSMGLTEEEAMEAIALERTLPNPNPSEFGGARSEGEMGALGGVGAMMPPPTPRGSTNMGMPEDAVMAQRMNQVDTRGMSPQQIDMLRMGRDPFAEGMVR